MKNSKLQYEVLSVIKNFKKDTFFSSDIEKFLPNGNRSSFTGSICNLVNKGKLFRTGKKRGAYVEYSRVKPNPPNASIIDQTALPISADGGIRQSIISLQDRIRVLVLDFQVLLTNGGDITFFCHTTILK